MYLAEAHYKPLGPSGLLFWLAFLIAVSSSRGRDLETHSVRSNVVHIDLAALNVIGKSIIIKINCKNNIQLI